MAYMNITGTRSTRAPLQGLGCGCHAPAVSGLGIDDGGTKFGAIALIGLGSLGLLYMASTSKLAMNRRRRRRRR